MRLQRIKIVKKWIKVSLFTNDMILCRKDHKDSTRKLTNTSSKVADCNVERKKKSVTFLKSNKKKTKNDIRKAILFTMGWIKSKIPLNKPIKRMNGFSNRNTNELKEIPEDEASHVHRLAFWKWPSYQKQFIVFHL